MVTQVFRRPLNFQLVKRPRLARLAVGTLVKYYSALQAHSRGTSRQDTRTRLSRLHTEYYSKNANTMTLTPSTDPLVWIDCEMTGLDSTSDRILSISCYVTDHRLNLVEEEGCHAIIATSKSVLDSMGEWCQKTHGQNGLIKACLSSAAVSADYAAFDVLAYIQKHVAKPRTALLAGNSVHADKMFLMQQPWIPILDHLHYRILDVSAIKEAAKRWCDQSVLDEAPTKKLTHTAKEDILESIAEARYYMGLFEQLGQR